MAVRDLIIIGGGPSGLSAAIAAKQRGLDYQVLEQGILVNSIYRFPPQMVFFTTPELLEIGGVPLVSPYEKPTRVEALKYYRRVADAFDLQIACREKVLSVSADEPSLTSSGSRQPGASVFAVETRSSRGVRRVRHAHAVVFAIGYFDHPNRLDVPGEALPHVHHYYSEPYPYYRQRVVIVGGGNSAAEAALEMYRAGVNVTLVHRRPELKSTIKYWVRPDIENRIKEGTISARFNACVTEIRPTSVIVRPVAETVEGGTAEKAQPPVPNDRADTNPVEGTEELWADAVFLLTGYRADADLMQRAGIRLDDRQAPVYDPETFETNVPGLYVAGGALAGEDTGTIFIENGRFHGERIVAVIASRLR